VPVSAEQLVLLLQRFSAGYAGLELGAVEPPPSLILGHSAYVVVLYGVRCWNRPLGPTSSTRFAIACIIVLWFAYYAKGPHFWNLWTLLFLYSFLMGSMMRWSYARSMSARWGRLARDWRLSALCLIIIPAIAFSNLLLIPSARRVFEPQVKHDGARATEVSGIRLSSDLARSLLEKAQFVRDVRSAHGDRMLFLTANSFTVPLLTGFFPALPFQDAFTETITHEDFVLLKERIAAVAPEVILVDEPGGALSGYQEQQAFYLRLMRDLSASYRPTGVSRGWQVWRRHPS
jgi:hypothetical protein